MIIKEKEKQLFQNAGQFYVLEDPISKVKKKKSEEEIESL